MWILQAHHLFPVLIPKGKSEECLLGPAAISADPRSVFMELAACLLLCRQPPCRPQLHCLLCREGMWQWDGPESLLRSLGTFSLLLQWPCKEWAGYCTYVLSLLLPLPHPPWGRGAALAPGTSLPLPFPPLQATLFHSSKEECPDFGPPTL